MSIEIKIPKKQKNALALATKETDEFLEILDGLEIDSEEGFEMISSLALEYKQKQTDFENQRKYITDPLNETRNRINQLFNPPIKALKQCIDICRTKIVEYQALENDDPLTPPPLPHTTPVSKKIQPRSKLAWRVNYDKFDEIPKKYLCVDRSAIEIEFKKQKANLDIPGIELYEEKTVAFL